MGFPHYPQVSPQVKQGKPLINWGFIRGDKKNQRFYPHPVENYLVYRTLSKIRLGGENPGVSGANICPHKRTIQPQNIPLRVAQLQLLTLQGFAHVADGYRFHRVILVVIRIFQIAKPV